MTTYNLLVQWYDYDVSDKPYWLDSYGFVGLTPNWVVQLQQLQQCDETGCWGVVIGIDPKTGQPYTVGVSAAFYILEGAWSARDAANDPANTPFETRLYSLNIPTTEIIAPSDPVSLKDRIKFNGFGVILKATYDGYTYTATPDPPLILRGDIEKISADDNNSSSNDLWRKREVTVWNGVRKQMWDLYKMTGSKGMFYKRKTSGTRCPVCWDTNSETRVKTQCTSCYNTGFSNGYYWPQTVYFRRVGLDKEETINVDENVVPKNQNVIQIDMPIHPLTDVDDILVLIASGTVYRVVRSKQNRASGIQRVTLEEIPVGDVRYQFLQNAGDWNADNNPSGDV